MIAKLRLVFAFSALFFSFYGYSQNSIWQKVAVSDSEIPTQLQKIDVTEGQFFDLNEQDFVTSIKGISSKSNNSKIVYFPDENGTLLAFQVKETPVLSATMSAKYPDIKSFSGVGVDNTANKIKFSTGPNGIQSMIVYGDKRPNTFLQKVGKQYVSYNRALQQHDIDFICSTKEEVSSAKGLTSKIVDDQVVRKYKLAVSASGEYTAYHGGTVAGALAAINATVTRVNQVFETDLAITLELVDGLEGVIFLNEDTDPYGGNLSGQVQNTLKTNLGEAFYDIGILFHKNAVSDGNSGYIGVVCVDNKKGSAYVAVPDPVGDIFDLDYVAHEMGHQFGANHTWSYQDEETGVQAEPASGSTIMGYAGIAGEDNVAGSGDDYFHYYSILQISEFVKQTNCAEVITITNNPPTITALQDYIIPKSTAFVLEGEATDVDGDDLTYVWEQIDFGVVTKFSFGPSNSKGANFRSLPPSIDSVRYLPKLSRVIAGELTEVQPTIGDAWETVSDVERDLNFAFTVRDNAAGGGQVTSELMQVKVVDVAGPFKITSDTISASYEAGSVHEITWDVAGTDAEPINAQRVDIFLSIDGGLTFPHELANNVLNSGAHKVIIPSLPTINGRVMVRPTDNIFYAVNSSDFTIVQSEIVMRFAEQTLAVCKPNNLETSFEYEPNLGFNEEVTFSVTKKPEGLEIAFSQLTAIVKDTIGLTISETDGIAKGNYEIEITATSATKSKAVTLNLNILDTVYPDVVLVSPVNDIVDVSINQELVWEENDAYTSYQVQIATDASFKNVVEDIMLITNSFSPKNLENFTPYYWRVKPFNYCGSGTFGPHYKFTTLKYKCLTKESEDLPQSISANGTPTITSKVVFYQDVPLVDLKVNLELTHAFLNDLQVTLTSPEGTSIVLFSKACGKGGNVNATFTDLAESLVCGTKSTITGDVKPLGALSVFRGESIQGEWILEVFDTTANDGGSLNGFSLEVCIEGDFRPDADEDGVFDDGDDLCLDTPKGTQVNASGCPVIAFPANTFTVKAEGETCRSNNDGSINVTASLSLDYTVTITGGTTPITADFTTNYTASDLSAGNYTVCINAKEGDLSYIEQCFTIVVSEPEALKVNLKASLDGTNVTLDLNGGNVYTITLNGKSFNTQSNEVTLDLEDGFNEILVTTDLECQGVFKESIVSGHEAVFYPNPFKDELTMFLGGEQDVQIELFTPEGKRVLNKTYKVINGTLTFNIEHLAQGLYYLKYYGVSVQGNTKILKK